MLVLALPYIFQHCNQTLSLSFEGLNSMSNYSFKSSARRTYGLMRVKHNIALSVWYFSSYIGKFLPKE